jgi:hypothetical protein
MSDDSPAIRSHDGPLKRFTCCSINWIASAAGEQVVRRLENSLADVLAGRGGPPVKSNPLRRVYRLAVEVASCPSKKADSCGMGILPMSGTAGSPTIQDTGKMPVLPNAAGTGQGGGDCIEAFLKRFDESSPRAWAKRWVRGPAARREFHGLRRAWLAGAPVPQPLACGVGNNVSYLLTASCQPGEAENFSGWLDAHGWDDRCARTLVELLITTWSVGLLHDDLHVGNILYRAGDQPRMWLLDLGRARMRKSCSGRQIIANLALLAAGLVTWPSEDQLNAFVGDVRSRVNERWPGLLPDWPEFIGAVRAAARRRRRAGRRHRLHAILGTNNYFARVRLPGGWVGHVFLRRRAQQIDPNSAAASLRVSAADWIAALDRLVRSADSASGARSAGTTRSQTLQIGEHRMEVIVERGRDRSAWPVLRYFFFRGPATRRFRAPHAALMLACTGSTTSTESVQHVDSTGLPLAAIQRPAGVTKAEWLIVHTP